MICKNYSIGIISGAGPTAGAFLLQKIIAVCQYKYQCKQDSDFPFIFLMSYPFNDMLGENVDERLIKQQLKENISRLIANNIDYAVIACNTLHAFLPNKIEGIKLVHIIDETKKYLSLRNWTNPLILCSSTASKSKLHSNFFECYYPDVSTQMKIDELINMVTAGCCLKTASSALNLLVVEHDIIVLGCTELSVIHETVPLKHSKICNPNEIIANTMCNLVFSQERVKI